MNKLKEETYDYTLPSEDEIQDYCYRQAQLRIGEANSTEYELNKDWIFKKVGNEITLLAYKGEE